MSELIFYTTQGCHLCTLAETVLANLKLTEHVNVIDISSSEALVDTYGTSIPVLKDSATGETLAWPFDENKLMMWLQA